MPYLTPTINGTPFPTATAIQAKPFDSGVQKRAANGTPLTITRGTKRAWTITFSNLTYSQLQAVANIASLTANFTFVDEQGNSYTVCEELNSFSFDVVHYGTAPEYTATLGLWEV